MKLPFKINLENKVCVVTGAGGVICSHLARALAQCGAKVALLDLNKDAAEVFAKEIREEGGIAYAYEANVLKKDSLEACHREILKDLGKCDILINGAGGNNPRATTDNEYAKLWNDVYTPKDAMKKIEFERNEYKNINPSNLEEQAINLVGTTIYEKLIKGYTAKQWGRSCTELPSFIIKRIPIRFKFDNNYFDDKYQGIPIGGYTQIIEKMLLGVDILLNTDYLERKEEFNNMADNIIYSGPIDAYFDYKFGKLNYRSLKFEIENINTENYQGNAVVNYTDINIPYTRIIEHKFFEDVKTSNTIISKEYPVEWNVNCEPYYPINDDRNTKLYNQYYELSKQEYNVHFGGRLGQYKYYNMDDVILDALSYIKSLF